MDQKTIEQIKEIIRTGQVKEGINLAQYTSIKIGGFGKVLVETGSLEDIKALFALISREHLPFFILGGGSNIIFADPVYEGIVIHYRQAEIESQEQKTAVQLTVDSGIRVQQVAKFCLAKGYSGFEYLYGLPGTIGGAVWQNSKWPKQNFSIAQIIKTVSFLQLDGRSEQYLAEQCQFGYGTSIFQKLKGLIYQVKFELKKANSEELNQLAESTLAYRRQSQPLTELTAGCAFKNISEAEQKQFFLPTRSAGYLIDQAGLKNLKVGKIEISSVHANFLVNRGGATAQDFLKIVAIIKQKVKNQFGVTLREEINIIK